MSDLVFRQTVAALFNVKYLGIWLAVNIYSPLNVIGRQLKNTLAFHR